MTTADALRHSLIVLALWQADHPERVAFYQEIRRRLIVVAAAAADERSTP